MSHGNSSEATWCQDFFRANPLKAVLIMHSWKGVLKETSIRLFWDHAVIKVFVFGCASWGGLVGTVAISFPSVRNNFITIITAFYRRGQAAFTGKTTKDLSFFTKHWFSSRLNFSLFSYSSNIELFISCFHCPSSELFVEQHTFE